MRLEARSDGIEPARQRTQQLRQLIAGELLGIGLEQIDELTILGEARERAIRRQQLRHILAARELRIAIDERTRQRGDVEALHELGRECGIALETDGGKHLLREVRIVLGQKADRITGLVDEPGCVDGKLRMPGLARRARAVEIDEGRNLGLGRIVRGEQRLVRKVLARNRSLEIHMHDRRRGWRVGRRDHFERLVGPGCGLLGEVEVEIDAIGDARGAQRLEARIDLLASLAEVDIGGVAEREHGETEAVQTRRVLGHQNLMEIHGALRRISFAPRRDIDDEVLHLRELRRLGIGHIDDAHVVIQLGGKLLGLEGQRLGVSGLAAIKNSERHARALRRNGLSRRHLGHAALSRIETGQKAGQPRALQRRRPLHELVQEIDVFCRERRSLWQKRNRDHSSLRV